LCFGRRVLGSGTASGLYDPLGIGLEEFAYPYPVLFMPLENQGQSMRMAYMDIKPTGLDQPEAVILLHGKNFYGSYWDNSIKALSGADFRVIVPDQIGFGKSPKPASATA